MDSHWYGDYCCVDVNSGIAHCSLPSPTGEALVYLLLNKVTAKEHVVALQTSKFQLYITNKKSPECLHLD